MNSSLSDVRANNENYFKLLTASVETLFSHCDEADHAVRLAADENINKLVKVGRKTRVLALTTRSFDVESERDVPIKSAGGAASNHQTQSQCWTARSQR